MADTNHGVAHPHAHHFASADDEFEASKQGMWVFLVTEVLMFGGLFVAYTIFRGMYPEMFHEGQHLLDKTMGAINTVILITSSLTMVLAVSATQKGRRDQAILFLIFTFLLACGFLVVKYFEYSHKIHVGTLPGGLFNMELYLPTAEHQVHHPKLPLFFSLYFIMTGLHGLHVLIGMGVIAWVLKRTLKGEFSPHYYTPVELVGFYWHFVDLVWIYLFPLMYLVG
jgi:cytochrome c oxidase subunit III